MLQSLETKLQIAELYQEDDLSIGAIADHLGVSPRSVHNYKNYREITRSDTIQGEENNESLTKEEETDLQIYEMIHSGHTDSEIAKKVGISEDTVRKYRSDQKNAYEEDSEDIQKEPEQINFIGGKSFKSEEPEKEEFEYECGNCHKEFDGKPERCPHCGSELEWSEAVAYGQF